MLKKLISAAEEAFEGQPEATLLEALRLLSRGEVQQAEDSLAAAIGISEMLDGQLEWINHPSRVVIEKVERLEGEFRVTVKYRDEEYRTAVRIVS